MSLAGLENLTGRNIRLTNLSSTINIRYFTIKQMFIKRRALFAILLLKEVQSLNLSFSRFYK